MTNKNQPLTKIIKEDKVTKYYLNEQLHRKDGPAIIYEHGTTEWYLNGKLHREDGPAIKTYNGIEKWYLNGKLHRENGPAIDGSGSKDKMWYLNGKLHRKDGPAIEYDDRYEGEKWYLNGKLHRENGPATIFIKSESQWHLDGKQYTKESYDKEMHKRSNPSAITKIIIALREKIIGQQDTKDSVKKM